MPTKRKDRKGREVWYGRITLTMPDGSTRRKEKSFPSKKDALAWESQKAPVASHPGTTCGEWLDARTDDYAARGAGKHRRKAPLFQALF